MTKKVSNVQIRVSDESRVALLLIAAEMQEKKMEPISIREALDTLLQENVPAVWDRAQKMVQDRDE